MFFEATDWRVFPNPTTGLLEISGPEHGQALSFRLTDQLGRVARSGTMTERRIDLGEIPAGIYYLQLSDVARQSVHIVVKE